MEYKKLLLGLARKYLWGAGRVGRLTFLIKHLSFMVIGGSFGGTAKKAAFLPEIIRFVMLACALVCIWGIWCNIVQRLHNLGYSGLEICLFFVPIVNIFAFLYLLVKPGITETNEYGPPSGAAGEL